MIFHRPFTEINAEGRGYDREAIKEYKFMEAQPLNKYYIMLREYKGAKKPAHFLCVYSSEDEGASGYTEKAPFYICSGTEVECEKEMLLRIAKKADLLETRDV